MSSCTSPCRHPQWNGRCRLCLLCVLGKSKPEIAQSVLLEQFRKAKNRNAERHHARHNDVAKVLLCGMYIALKNVKTHASYLLGLLAMIKCSICSYQCDNWYVSNWRLACHIIFAWGGCQLGLPSAPQMLPWHGTLLWATHPHG